MFIRYQTDGAVATAHDIAHLTKLHGRPPLRHFTSAFRAVVINQRHCARSSRF
jgi:hypothetical protein